MYIKEQIKIDLWIYNKPIRYLVIKIKEVGMIRPLDLRIRMMQIPFKQPRNIRVKVDRSMVSLQMILPTRNRKSKLISMSNMKNSLKKNQLPISKKSDFMNRHNSKQWVKNREYDVVLHRYILMPTWIGRWSIVRVILKHWMIKSNRRILIKINSKPSRRRISKNTISKE